MTIKPLETKAALADEHGREIVAGSPASIICQAITGGADLEKLEKLLELQERWEANEAKKAYNHAMAAFKAHPPDIEKDKKVEFKTSVGMMRYNHASLANVTEKINASLSRYGLSASWITAQSPNGVISVTCKITHDLGHSETTTLSAGPDGSGSKNSIQAIGSTISYLERYTLLALTGLATHEMDDDGQPPVTEPQEIKPEAEVETPVKSTAFDPTGMTEMVSKFDGQCASCLDKIEKGEPIFFDNKSRKAYHRPPCYVPE